MHRNKLTLILALAGLLLASSYIFSPEKPTKRRPFPVTVDDNGLRFSVISDSEDLSQFFHKNHLELGENDFIFPPLETKIIPGQIIVIRRALQVSVDVDQQKIQISTLGTTVRDAIATGNITLSHADKITPDLNSVLEPELAIKITRINFEEITFEEEIPFQTIEKEDSKVLWNKKEIKQVGEKGIKEKTYKITYTNGKETNRVLLDTRIAKQPVQQIEVVGTKIVVGKTQQGSATWYSNGDELTCASLTFPHGTYVRVTNRGNGKSVIVKVNDSGPYGEGRVIDLNDKAFKKIAGLGEGVIKVKVEEILN